ncbi:outer membrane beta-barrel family protein [Pedobacter sp.]|uniref:outer membrane beta-barrel family protein n=1 Tax=Pedobacter sp. TaxID=1411316 RepID=UPI0031D76D74
MRPYITFTLSLLLPVAVWAQTPEKPKEKDTTIVLNTVSVSGKKPLLKRKADRLEFNIENTPLQNLSGWDILKNTPNVVVKNEELTIRGSSQILVTINDKKTLMSQEQLKAFLENTDGKNISSIEVITNPPAKYEAQGGAVLNIKMKQNKLLGYKGTLSSRYHQSIYAKGRLGLAQSFNTDKLQVSGNYDFVSGNYVRKNFDVVIFDNNNTRWESDMVRKSESHQQHLYNFSSQYSLDSLTTFQFGFDGNFNPNLVGRYNVPTNIYNTLTNQLESNYVTLNQRDQRYGNFNAYLVLDKKFGSHNLTLSNNYSNNTHKEDQDVATTLRFINQPEEYRRFANNNKQHIKLFATQLDYRLAKNSFIIESGLKYSHVNNRNDLRFLSENGGLLVFDPTRSNLFNYDENIYAAYISSEYKWKKWEMKLGLRSETTQINTDSDNPLTQNANTRTNIFPTFYLMHQLNENQQLGLSYGKRINRPNYSFLNPSKSYYNLYAYFQGDANLKSTMFHNISLTYTLKDWNFETYYSYIKNPSMEISIQNPETFETKYHYTNISKGEIVGVNMSKSFSITNLWKLNLFVLGEYNEDFFMGVDNQLYKNNVFFYNANISTQITLDKEKTWDLSASYTYNSRSVQGSFSISPSQRTNIVLNKKMFNKRFETGLILNDIFKTDKNTISTRYANQNQYFKDYRDTQYFMINLKFHFGNQKVKDAKAANKTEEQKRL